MYITYTDTCLLFPSDLVGSPSRIVCCKRLVFVLPVESVGEKERTVQGHKFKFPKRRDRERKHELDSGWLLLFVLGCSLFHTYNRITPFSTLNSTCTAAWVVMFSSVGESSAVERANFHRI